MASCLFALPIRTRHSCHEPESPFLHFGSGRQTSSLTSSMSSDKETNFSLSKKRYPLLLIAWEGKTQSPSCCCCCCQVASVVSDSVRPHRQQPNRLLCPWDSPGKNTGVGCHCLLQCMKVKSESEVAQSSLTVCDPIDCSLPGSSAHGIFQARVLEWGAIAFSSA